MSGSMKKLLSHADLIAAVAVVMVVVMMIVPLPPGLIDLFITLNIASAITIVVATLYVPRALDFAAFPSLLLLTTMFRLAINVSVTRQILLHGDGGSVVKAFGSFVVGGNVIVGLVVFLILIVIQFVVVTNGAGRVAEVAARFTLDAMPGKQMAIDADLNAGQINDQQAHQRRDDVAREADFYGAMDGASKFVKGDAVAGILIVSINLIGGIVVGVMQQGLSFPEAAQHYSLLTVGDGLAAQIPALLISVAAGILVTRSASQKDLGNDIAGQIFAQRKAPMVAAGVICAFALVPGLPKIPFLLIGGALAAVAYALKDGMPQASAEAVPGGGRGPLRPGGPRRRPGPPRRQRSPRPGDRGRPARAGDRLRPRAAGRSRSGRRPDGPRRGDAKAARRRTRDRDPGGADPRRARPRLARIRAAGARLGGRPRADHARPPAGDGLRRGGGPAARRPDHRARLRPARDLGAGRRAGRGRGARLHRRRP